MIVSSQVDWFCRTQRVGFVCRYCREALTTVTLEEPPGLETCSDRGGLRDAVPSAPTIRGNPGPFNDRCGGVTFSERCDFRCGSN
jgi:hypothetical protein